MKKLYIDSYSISITLEPDYNLSLVDNLPYDKIIILSEIKTNKNICIRVEKDNCIKKILIKIPYYIKLDNCALTTKEYLFLIFDNLLCLFDPRTMTIIKQKRITSATGSIFMAYPYEEDFILHGEVEIYRVTKNLEIKWCFSGKDIFVRYHINELEPAFKMKSDRICLYDFMDNYYEINYDGILINLKNISKE